MSISPAVIAPRTILVVPSCTLFSVLMPLAFNTSMIMFPSSEPSVSIFDATRTAGCACVVAETVVTAIANAIHAKRESEAFMAKLRLMRGDAVPARGRQPPRLAVRRRLRPRVAERIDESMKLVSDDFLRAFEQQCILERILGHLAQFGQVFVEYLDFLDAGNQRSVIATPYRRLILWFGIHRSVDLDRKDTSRHT